MWLRSHLDLLLTSPDVISARIGRVTGKGLAGNMRGQYPLVFLYGLVGLLLVANVTNLGADLGDGGRDSTFPSWSAVGLCRGFRNCHGGARGLSPVRSICVNTALVDDVVIRYPPNVR
jgi:hypothetical protein